MCINTGFLGLKRVCHDVSVDLLLLECVFACACMSAVIPVTVTSSPQLWPDLFAN